MKFMKQKKYADFLDIEFSDQMLNSNYHIDMGGNVLTKERHSSFPGSKKEVKWPDVLSYDEINFVEHVCGPSMLSFDYTLLGNQNKSIQFLNNIVLNDDLLSKRYRIFQILGQGAEEYPSDPTNEINWGSDNSDPDAVGARALYGKKKKYINQKDDL